jgi:hypothetical protein
MQLRIDNQLLSYILDNDYININPKYEQLMTHHYIQLLRTPINNLFRLFTLGLISRLFMKPILSWSSKQSSYYTITNKLYGHDDDMSLELNIC